MARFSNGWVKVHRRMFAYNENFDFLTIGILTWLIGAANTQESKILWRGKPRMLSRGQVLTSIKELWGESTDYSPKQVRLRIQRLVDSGTISVESVTHGTIITICNYDKYQEKGKTEGKPRENEGKTEVYYIEEEEKERRKEKKTFLSTSGEVDPPASPFSWFQNLWNEKCGSLAACQRITPKRASAVRQRLKEFPDRGYWATTFDRIMESPFLTGNNNTGWKATFDWIIRPDNSVKIMEGKYSGQAAKTQLDFSWMKEEANE